MVLKWGQRTPIKKIMEVTMRQVEIERLLQWTFCDQISKRAVRGVGQESSWGIVERHLRLGCSIDSSRSGGDAGDILSFPDADALVVAREVENLSANVDVDWLESKQFLLGDLAGLAPYEQVLSFNEIALVIEHAQCGIPPGWNVGSPKIGPVILANGKPAVSGSRHGKDRYSAGSHCPLQWAQPTIEGVALARARYAVWHSALMRLADSLRGKLKNIAVMPPTACAAPWNTETQSSR
jgi:hypothetical protein